MEEKKPAEKKSGVEKAEPIIEIVKIVATTVGAVGGAILSVLAASKKGK